MAGPVLLALFPFFLPPANLVLVKRSTSRRAGRQLLLKVSTQELRSSLPEERVEDVLASLQFRQVVGRYEVGARVTKVWMPAANAMVLQEMLTMWASDRQREPLL